MNSSVQPSRRIASNLLWTPDGLQRNPLVELGADGRILRITQCAEPDRMHSTEFYAGVLVPDFPADYRAVFTRMCAHTPPFLPDLLRSLPAGGEGVLAVISGLDYDTLHLTPRSQIRKL